MSLDAGGQARSRIWRRNASDVLRQLSRLFHRFLQPLIRFPFSFAGTHFEHIGKQEKLPASPSHSNFIAVALGCHKSIMQTSVSALSLARIPGPWSQSRPQVDIAIFSRAGPISLSPSSTAMRLNTTMTLDTFANNLIDHHLCDDLTFIARLSVFQFW
ncbi:hypothetical protein C8J56DRAFT_112896 [Mycena floridula]|nr:hypothetical protein C8J56DRAFT_112896 [Mycena floridula]